MGMTQTTPAPDIFSQLAQQNGGPQQSAVSTTAQPQAVTPQASQPSQQGQGDVFDQLANGSISPTQSVQNTPTPLAPTSDELRIQPGDSLLTQAGKAVGGTVEGVGEGVFSTGAGLSDIIDKATGQQPGAVNTFLHKEAGDYNQEHGTPQLIGQGLETLEEFLLGDQALKGLSLSDKLLKTGKVAQAIEASPRLAKAVDIGITALRSGTVQSLDTYVKSSGSAGQAAGMGTLAAGLSAGLGAGGATVNAIRAALDDSGLQPALQQGIRSILSDAADKAGVSAPTAQSIRDAAQQVSDGLRAKASSLYQTLDDISGGQAQRFRDAAQNVSDQLRNIVGLDDEKEAALIKRQAEIEAAHKAMLDKLAAAGHDPKMLQQADAIWRQQAAMSDLSNSIRQSTTGLRPELAKTATGATTPEAVNPKTLFTRVNRLNDRGRLAQAIGQDNANALLRQTDAALVQAQRFADNQKWAKVAAKVGLNLTGLGALSGGYELAKHLLQ